MKFDNLLEEPVVSLSDRKNYKILKLQNGLKVLLIKQQSDNDDELCRYKKYKSNAAAVALCVDVGSFKDPRDIQGMSHLLEHVIFMGSEKYPKENEFDQFVSSHGGYDNAYTESQYTVFHFDIIEKHLAGALDRFANLFISPLMSLDSIQREIIAVESEFQNNINDDDVRINQIYSTMICDEHPASNFIWGNSVTLKDGVDGRILYGKLHAFRRKYYTPNRMYLCIQSSIEISRLERTVIATFSDIPIPNDAKIHDTIASNNPFEIFKSDFHEKIFFVKSTSEKCKLLMTFLFPTNQKEYKFLEYLASLIQYEGPGSLSDYFMDELLALKVKARVGYQDFGGNSYFTFFTIDVNLTSRGFQDFDCVLRAIFAYLLLLKSTKLEEHETRFKEFKEISDTLFKYRKEKSAIENVQDIAVNMKYYDDKNIIIGSDYCPDFNASVMKGLIEKLNEKKFNLLILSDKSCAAYQMKEKWFQTEYSAVNFPQEYNKLWNERWLMNELYLPSPNKFICKSFGIFNNPTEQDEKFPRKIFENEICELYYKMDKNFKLPYAYVYIFFISPLSQLSTENLNMTSIYSMCVKNFLSEKLYPATLVGYSYKLNSVDSGLILRLNGFNEKLQLILEIITMQMKKSITKCTFETFRRELKKNCHNCMTDLNILNDDYRLTVLKQNHRSFHERYKQIDSIKYQDFKLFATKILETLKMKILIQGNIVKARAEYLKELIVENLKPQKINDFPNEAQIYELPLGSTYIKNKSLRNNDYNAIIKNYYQAGRSDIKLESLTEILASILMEPLFDILRTHQQLGYGINCSARKNNRVMGLVITVEYQENLHSSEFIDAKIEEFLIEYQNTLNAMSEEDFIAAKRCFISSKLTSNTDLEVEVIRNFDEIRNYEDVFNRRELEADEIENITKKESLEFYRKVLLDTATKRKLSVQITGTNGANENCETKSVNNVENCKETDFNELQACCKVYS
ncbi:hypothetical protein ACKWTF_001634 [Chironomus riparius]